jgi:predicted esterase
MMDAVRHCTFSARLDCHYLLREPEAVEAGTLLVVALHGFGQTPEVMLQLTEKLFGRRHVMASLEGPNRFFLGTGSQEVGCGWITSRHAPSAIRLHHDMVLHVLNEAGRENGIPPERRVLVGFSQSVSLNYRLAATCPDSVRGVVAVCGGLPGDWENAPYQCVKAAVLHLARREDQYYPPAVTEHYPERLRMRVKDVEFHLLDGGHSMPSRGGPIVEGWLKRILG